MSRAVWRARTDAALGSAGAQALLADSLPGDKTTAWVLGGSWQNKATARPRPVAFTSTINERTGLWNWARRMLPVPKGADAASVLSLAKTRGATVVAVGNSRRGNDVDAAIWTSTDRRSWKLFHSGERVKGLQNLTAVATTEHGFVAVGTDEDSPLVVRGTRRGLKRLRPRVHSPD